MNQKIMNKTLLASAIALSLSGTNAHPADTPTLDSIEINNMVFNPQGNFTAGGFLNRNNVPGPDTPLDQVTSFDLVAGGRVLKPNIDPLDFTGTIFSLDNFNGHSWVGTQQTVFMDNQATWSGTSGQGAFDFNNTLADAPGTTPGPDGVDYIGNMTDNQFAVGIFFDWNGSNGIALLEIFTCDNATHTCVGEGVPMENGPFAGSVAIFSGGPLPLDCSPTSALTDVNKQIDIPLTDVAANCDQTISSVITTDDTSANGATVSFDGTNFLYTPVDGFEGPDSFNVTLEDDRSIQAVVVINVQVGGELQNNFTMLGSDGSATGGSNDVDIEWDEVTFNSAAIVPDSDQGDPDQDGLEGFGIPTEGKGVMTVGSPQKFFGFNWFANNVRVYKGPVKLRFDISCTLDDYENDIVECNRPLPVDNVGKRWATMEVADGQIGGHMIFDWGSTDGSTPCKLKNCDIDVINVWEQNVEWNDPDGFGGINELWTGAAGIPPASNDPINNGAAKWVLTPGDSDGDGINGQRMIDGAFKGSSANFNYKPDKAGVPAKDFDGQINGVKVDAFAANIWSLLAGFLSLVGLRKFKNNK